MDWHKLFASGAGSASAGPADADHSLLVPTGSFFESLSAPPPPPHLSLRPPSIPPDLEPSPLFPPSPRASAAQDAAALASHLPLQPPTNALGLHIGVTRLPPAHTLAHQLHQHQSSSAAPPTQLTLPLPQSALFDSSEEAYLNSFLSSFDVDGLDIGPYLASPLPMANISSRTDFAGLGMGMGMGIGAGMIGPMDDSIPHLSLDEAADDAAHGLTHMVSATAPHSARAAPGGSLSLGQQHQQLFDYGLGGTSHLSLGNVMSEEMRRVSSWVMHGHGHPSPLQSNPPAPLNLAGAAPGPLRSAGSHPSPFAHRFTMPPSASAADEFAGLMSPHAPPSESDMSVKRKAMDDHLGQPRKARGSARSPVRETMPSLAARVASNTAGAYQSLSPHTPTTPSLAAAMAAAAAAAAEAESALEAFPGAAAQAHEEGAESGESGSPRRRESKKAQPRMTLTEDERRANHIASEQRRRNQIRQGYAELMTLVTTLHDPALGNHPGTAQSTPSKAVILAHAVQFIHGLEEGNQVLRKRLDAARPNFPQLRLSSQALAGYRPSSPAPPQ
ncbi:hypothetical protein LPJ61_001058 [Coemansia biformis]|uniref:BHLH domain-containing protein n=1 Tax=Coemansia biformis TaxID=1286918 RepID=A0A9W8CZY6_9FUNG|nr:hypothetical protein LPJ61_001058 [Coemansia biformis]